MTENHWNELVKAVEALLWEGASSCDSCSTAEATYDDKREWTRMWLAAMFEGDHDVVMALCEAGCPTANVLRPKFELPKNVALIFNVEYPEKEPSE
jgi:hypothetical protein